MKTKTKNKISLKAILIVALLLMVIILPSMSSILPVNAATMYSVNLYDHDGTLLYSDSFEANSSSFKYPAYNGVGMPGYEFVGWKVGSQIKKAGVTVGNMISNITGTASFAEIEDTTYYTVTFNPNGGTLASGSLSQSVISGGSATAPTVTRSGYTFSSWSGAYTNVTSDRTVTAQWTQNTTEYYTVTFYGDGGLSGSASSVDVSVPKGGKVSSSDIPTFIKSGYIFLGFASLGHTTIIDFTQYTITSSQSFLAQWAEGGVTYYTVTFDLAGGSRVSGGALSQSVSSGGNATAPTTTRNGYTFTGWAGSYTNVTSDRTITALWTQNTEYYAVTFYGDGGLCGQASSINVNVVKGEKVKTTDIPVFEKNGYDFIGFASLGTTTIIDVTQYTISNSQSFVAIWEANTPICTVYFSTGGAERIGGGALIQQIPYGSKITNPPILEIVGFEFRGWHNGTSEIIDLDTFIVEGETYLTTDFAPLFYDVTFDSAGGTITSGDASQRIKHGNDAVPPTVTLEGYTFSGWSDTYTNVTSDRTLTAQWKQNVTYNTVQFYGNGGSWTGVGCITSFEVINGESISADKIPVFVRDGYTFIGFASIGHTDIVDFTQKGNYSGSYIAMWVKKDVITSKIITATITPADADNKLVDWTVSWANNATRKNEDISQYITITSSSSDGLKVVVTCLKAFEGDTIIITVTTRDGNYSAQCLVTYAATGVN